MNARQREMARHALGLPNKKNETCRNFYCTTPDTEDYAPWMEMVSDGLAAVHPPPDTITKMHVFSLTQKGAMAVLEGKGKTAEKLSKGFRWYG